MFLSKKKKKSKPPKNVYVICFYLCTNYKTTNFSMYKCKYKV